MSKKPPSSKRSTSSGGKATVDLFNYTAGELEVAKILAELLPHPVRKFKPGFRLPDVWAAKRKRSVPGLISPISDTPEILPVSEKLEYVSNSPVSPFDFIPHADSNLKNGVPDKRLKPSESKSNDPSELKLELKLFSLPEAADPPRAVVDSKQTQLAMLQLNHEMGPSRIPDLNISAVEDAPVLGFEMEFQYEQHNIADAAKRRREEAAAMARKRRHLIQKGKKALRVRMR